MLANNILDFLFNIQFPVKLPKGVEVMNPFTDEETKRVCTRFYQKYYSDDSSRYCIIGINPGRFGGGVTGIPFTDPIRLEKDCNIHTEWPKKQELSSVFIYEMISAFGGVDQFYSKFYFTAVSPLGFTKAGKNLNYYDDKELAKSIVPFSIDCFRKQLAWGLQTSVAFCLGEGTNFKFLTKLNEQYRLFDKIEPLSHPRFIMQYRLKRKQEFIDNYLKAFNKHNII
jgi:hypothetical protein